MKSILIANRGEIAIRIAQTARDLGVRTVGIYSEDDAESLHCRKVDEALLLNGVGPAAYLNENGVINAAKRAGATLIHPGYGFLSESGAFARACAAAGLTFVGPRPELLDQLGDKAAARRLAAEQGVPLILGQSEPIGLEEAHFFFNLLPAGASMVIKSVSGGGGIGMRVVHDVNELENAFQQCQNEAQQAFGDRSVYVEQYLPRVRHIEIQMIGDGEEVAHLWERDCSLQRRFQKMIEIVPAPGMPDELRQKLISAATRMAQAVRLDSLATFEFLVEGPELHAESPFYFIEANPRLQVEHTITEELLGIDLVQAQIRLAEGKRLADLNLPSTAVRPSRSALQVRITSEKWEQEGGFRPTSGEMTRYVPPSGRGVRVDGHGYSGYRTNPRFDSLQAKLSISLDLADDFFALKSKACISLHEFTIEGIETSLTFARALFDSDILQPNVLHTRLLDEIQLEIAQITAPEANTPAAVPAGQRPILSPMPGSLLSIEVEPGDQVEPGQTLFLIEAMKMETAVAAPFAAEIQAILAQSGALIAEGDPILLLEPIDEAQMAETAAEAVDLDTIRPDLAEVFTRRAFGLDENRPKAVEKRAKRGGRTGRANVLDLCDPDSFMEYGSSLIAAQRTRRSLDDLIENTPADGLVSGFGRINGALFDDKQGRCLVMAYDYTVLAGTQGALNHKKMDRMFKLADQWETPIVLFAEGGGGRPGDVDYMGVAQLDVMTFSLFAKLSGRMPRIAIVNGYCFAGNAALAGAADVIIATESTSLGMGGPAMIEGGGLGRYHPREVGPAEVHVQNGGIDILVEDEAAAVVAAKQYLSYFQGPLAEWECSDQRLLRQLIPENRRRVYDIRSVIETLADSDSVLELRPKFGGGIVTALVRIEGRPIGLIANNPAHLGGAVDVEGAHKMADFMALCNTFGIPLLSLVDTPGFMVGPEAEKTGMVKASARLFTIGAQLKVPFLAVILRKGYGLGAQAMCAGSFHVPLMTLSWPTGEFGAMGLEGAVQLGFRKELAAIEDPAERQAAYEKMVAQAYENGKALNTASYMELDEVIDPLETRARILSALTLT